jgi:hypothetical protein
MVVLVCIRLTIRGALHCLSMSVCLSVRLRFSQLHPSPVVGCVCVWCQVGHQADGDSQLLAHVIVGMEDAKDSHAQSGGDPGTRVCLCLSAHPPARLDGHQPSIRVGMASGQACVPLFVRSHACAWGGGRTGSQWACFFPPAADSQQQNGVPDGHEDDDDGAGAGGEPVDGQRPALTGSPRPAGLQESSAHGDADERRLLLREPGHQGVGTRTPRSCSCRNHMAPEACRGLAWVIAFSSVYGQVRRLRLRNLPTGRRS